MNTVSFKRHKVLFLLPLLLLAFYFYIKSTPRDNYSIYRRNIQKGNSSPHVKIYELTNAVPTSWNDVRCKKSAKVQEVQTTLCVHDIQKDVHVSGAIWTHGVWEANIITSFLQHIIANPDSLVLDFGAQIGQYSLFAASMGRKVLTVEPFYENIKRIHKAAKQENIASNIKLVQNAISNKRNEIKLLAKNDQNIGGQSLVHTKTYTKQEMASNPYLVETILMNDLVDQIPLRGDGTMFKSAILKIDIEGSEPFAFEHADLFFDSLDIHVIFMEWGNFPLINQNKKVEDMIDFLTQRSMVPYGGSEILQKSNWMKWPWDIVWIKKTA